MQKDLLLNGVNQECLEIEFDCQKIPYVSQKEMKLRYRDRQLKKTYQPDFICYDKIIVDIKALSSLIDENRAQLINYLNAAEMKLGFLMNFGHFPKLEYERLILSDRKISRETSIKLPDRHEKLEKD